MHTHTHVHIHTRAHTHIHTHTHTRYTQVILPQGSEVRLLNFLLPLISVTLSMALGAFGGLLLGTLLLRSRPSVPPSVLQSSTQQVAEAQQASRYVCVCAFMCMYYVLTLSSTQ